MLPPKIVKHLQVLRVNLDTPLVLFNGAGEEISAKIIAVNKKVIQVVLQDDCTQESPPQLKLHLGQALCRFDRMDFIIQKAVELNVSSITPLYAERSQGRIKPAQLEAKLSHWQEIIIHACEQCGQNYLPKLHPPLLLTDWVKEVQDVVKLNFTPDRALPLKLISNTAPSACTLLIGPEGGLSPAELALCDQAAFERVSLGPQILRVETAAILALGMAQYHFSNANYGLKKS